MATGDLQILIVHGPNLNQLGRREPAIYGRVTLAEIDRRLAERAAELGVRTNCFQSNHEGAIIDYLQERADAIAGAITGAIDGLIINPGALTHYGLSLRDALASLGRPIVEVHLSNVYARPEEWRHHSVVAPLALGQIAGFGWRGYLAALDLLVSYLRENNS